MNRTASRLVTATVIGVWLLAAVSAWPAFPARMQSRMSLEESLRERLERFRLQMPCGVDGGPPLAPFQLDELDLTQSIPGSIETTGTMRNLTVKDLDTFNVDYLTFSLFRLRLEYSITLPRVRATGEYNLNATVLDSFDVWGAGPFEFNAYNVNVNGFLRLSISLGGQLSVVEMETLASVDRIESRIEGVLGSEEGSDFYNGLIEILLPDLLSNNQRELSDALSELLMPLINEELSGMTLADLIAAAANDDEDEVLCVVESA